MCAQVVDAGQQRAAALTLDSAVDRLEQGALFLIARRMVRQVHDAQLTQALQHSALVALHDHHPHLAHRHRTKHVHPPESTA